MKKILALLLPIVTFVVSIVNLGNSIYMTFYTDDIQDKIYGLKNSDGIGIRIYEIRQLEEQIIASITIASFFVLVSTFYLVSFFINKYYVRKQ